MARDRARERKEHGLFLFFSEVLTGLHDSCSLQWKDCKDLKA